jgi:hypothetical protein
MVAKKHRGIALHHEARMDIASFLFGVALGLVMGGLVAWLAGRVTTARILARLDVERQGSAEKLALLAQTETKLREAFSSLFAEALRRNNQSFLELAQTKLGELQQSATSDLERRRKAGMTRDDTSATSRPIPP